MQEIHDQCVTHGRDGEGDGVDYVAGANIAGFTKVADAMLAFGHI
jgi:glutamate dehydrogenase (NADP+)